MNIGSASTGNLAPVLLKIPPFVRHIPDLGKVRLAWSAIEPFIPDVSTDPAIHLMLRENIGGLFWAPDIAVSRRSIICAPADPRKAVRLWEVAREAREAADLTLVLPNNARHWHSLRERAISDGGFVTCSDVNPWSIIRNGQEIITCSDVTEALPALGSLAGLSLWCLDEAMLWPGAADGDAQGKAAALVINATCYRSPFTGEIIQADEAVGLLIEWRDIMRRNRSVAVCAGMAWWKQDRIAEFFATADEHRPRPFFRRGTKAAIALARQHAGGIAVWSTRMPRQLEHCAHETGMTLYRVEDGFIRSAGLGSGMLPPASIIVDRAGIYYDPAKPSDLEILLSSHPLGTDLQARVRRLMDRVISEGVSKYARGGMPPELGAPAGKRVILVPGQVADDLSVLLGGSGQGGNLELLRRVRASEPEAFVVYRPHPDVDAGHRAGAIPDDVVLTLADRICREGGMAPLLDAVDEVHTLTSLTGFEALMRGKSVTTYGQPFYAGWGLTQDRLPVIRRNRILTIEQLAAATLLLYPRYIDPLTRLPCGPEVLVSRFAMTELWRPSPLMRLRRYQGICIRTLRRGIQNICRRLSPDRGF